MDIAASEWLFVSFEHLLAMNAVSAAADVAG